ncbi:hypothetical protein Tco_0989077 [Tanacetum coccineum]|uniref:Uncharacterized protein n=1 Tax=Tanacetum coccineum TaxID=301880 RepID=A0ABQ5ET64_9ASTR
MMTTGTRLPWSSHWRLRRVLSDGDGVAVIDQAVAWLSAVVTGTVVVARGIGGGRQKYLPEKFFSDFEREEGRVFRVRILNKRTKTKQNGQNRAREWKQRGKSSHVGNPTGCDWLMGRTYDPRALIA